MPDAAAVSDWTASVALDVGYWATVVGLIVSAVALWATNFITLPGNWFVLALAIAAVFIHIGDHQPCMSWAGVVVLGVLAVVGEVLEFFASAAGAAKQGASRRGVILAVAGAMGGSLAGATIGVPVPVVGPLLGALVGGGLGAFGGAYLGEWWKRDRQHRDRLAVAKAAFSGRLLGTLGKLLVGSVMLVVFAVGIFV